MTQFGPSVVVEVVRRIGVIKMDSPPVNALSFPLRKGVADALEALNKDAAIDAIVLIGAKKVFCAGADISEFSKGDLAMREPSAIDLANKLDANPKIVVAAIEGSALGGGLEIALGCHYRVALKGSKLGLPEVNIGLIPGAGGTQRLPRLVGVQDAIMIAAAGKVVSAEKALEIKLADKVIAGNLQQEAVAYTEQLVKSKAPLRRASQMPVSGSSMIFGIARGRIAKASPGMPAPLAALDAIEGAYKAKTFEEGMQKEAECFMRVFGSPESKALQHVFFAERAAAKVKGTPRAVKLGAVIGAGTMGCGIAMCFANVGIPVYVVEANQALLDKGMKHMESLWAATAKKGKMTQEDVQKRMKLLRPTLQYSDLRDVDVVVEAVVENMALKKTIFQKLDAACKPETILATNTSTLDINEIATATKRPHKVCGMHFFSPANVMKLLENVQGRQTDDETVATIMQLGQRLRKVCVIVGVCWGFVSNRMSMRYGQQAEMLLEEGATPSQVDAAIRKFGFPVGPFQMADLAGLDVSHNIRAERIKEGKGPAGKFGTGAFAEKLYQRGWYGQKNGKGYYVYANGSRDGKENPELAKMLEQHSKELGIKRRQITEKEIVERCIYALTNEGANCVGEGIARQASDVDVVWVFGFGFPPQKGGPLHYADAVGVKEVHASIAKYREAQGAEYWAPSPYFDQLVASKKRFGSK